MKKFVLILALSALAFAGTREDHLKQQQEQLQQLVAKHGGFEAIAEKHQAFTAEVRNKFAGKEGNRPTIGEMAFEKRISSASMLLEWKPLTGDKEAEGTPIEVIADFNRQLMALGVQLIVVPVPAKIEAYPDIFVEGGKDYLVSPARTRAMQALLERDVEVLDILPGLQAARLQSELPVYEVSGHHPSGFGAKLAGEMVAERLARLDLTDRDTNRFKAVERKATERVNPSVPMQAWQVQYADGKPYEHVGDSQVIVIGDSHALAFKDASWASHIARATGVAITDLSTSGGSNEAHQRLANMGASGLKERKAVIWIMTGAGLSRGPWEKASIPQETTLAGLITMGKIDEAMAMFEKWRHSDPERVYLDESLLNNMGYGFARGHKEEKAEAVFKLNTLIHPESPNTYDSLGEFYAGQGKQQLAIENFQKSLSLHPPENLRKSAETWLRRMGVNLDGTERTVLNLSEEAMNAFVGYYELNEQTDLSIYREGENLMAVLRGHKMQLKAETEMIFFTKEGLKMEFTREGEDLSVVCNMGAHTRSGKRVSKEPKNS